MWYLFPLLLVAAYVLFEYRLRRPDQFVLFDAAGTIGFRKRRWYPRHLSLAIPGTTHPMELHFDATAKGNIPIIIKLAVSVAASKTAITSLIRVGGWNVKTVEKSAKELTTVLHGQVKEFTEKLGLEQITSDNVRAHLMQNAEVSRQSFGLDLVSLTVQSIDPIDKSIAEALRQRESARILEQTEQLRQQARVAEVRARIKADEEISGVEHALELKKIALKREEQEQEARLAQQRTEEELKRSRMRLEFDREELGMLKENPQLLLLTPQAARLAEASQSLRNARTVVTLSPNDAEGGVSLAGLFQLFLEQYMSGTKQGEKKR